MFIKTTLDSGKQSVNLRQTRTKIMKTILKLVTIVKVVMEEVKTSIGTAVIVGTFCR